MENSEKSWTERKALRSIVKVIFVLQLRWFHSELNSFVFHLAACIKFVKILATLSIVFIPRCLDGRQLQLATAFWALIRRPHFSTRIKCTVGSDFDVNAGSAIKIINYILSSPAAVIALVLIFSCATQIFTHEPTNLVFRHPFMSPLSASFGTLKLLH